LNARKVRKYLAANHKSLRGFDKAENQGYSDSGCKEWIEKAIRSGVE
jgi:hypothetical protein